MADHRRAAQITLIAAVILAICGSYGQRIFDLVLGAQPLVLPRPAHVALISDEYPPFRLDTGGTAPRATSPRSRPTRPMR